MNFSTSKKQSIKLLILAFFVVAFIPLSIFTVYLINNKPKTIESRTNQIFSNNKTGIIDSNISFSFSNEQLLWRSNILKSEKNSYNDLNSINFEIFNDKTKINFLISEVYRSDQYVSFDPNYKRNNLENEFKGEINVGQKLKTISLNNRNFDLFKDVDKDGFIFGESSKNQINTSQTNLKFIFQKYNEMNRRTDLMTSITIKGEIETNFLEIQKVINSLTFLELR
ncbi:MAG: hypothetical protein ACRCXZ_08920 [Patescibacteria group bacterium]